MVTDALLERYRRLSRGRVRRFRPSGLAELARERIQLEYDRRMLARVREGRDVCWFDHDDPEPLVTIRIPTYNRGDLVKRSIGSALAQTYRNIEVLVVGDCCDEPTAAAVEAFDDPRLRFVNLGARGLYPLDPRQRWYVAGVNPMNAALDLARGSWIAPCDDDDELTPHHVEVLLDGARRMRCEWVFSKARWERRPDEWEVLGAEPLRRYGVAHGAVFYSAGLRFVKYSPTCWRIGEPADWNMWKRMQHLGVRMGFVDEITYVHYVEEGERT